jgi:signal transduction histidine kinase
VKISLAARLIAIMVLSVFLSSLVSILFVSSVTIRQVRGMNLQRDQNIALVVADSLSSAADKGELQLNRAIASQRMQGSRSPMGEGRMGHGMMKPPEEPQRSPLRNILPGQTLVLEDGNDFIPLIITDKRGKILQGQYRGIHDNDKNHLSSKIYKQGAPYYLNGQITGYVLAGNQAGQSESRGDLYQVASIVRGILLYPLISALLASLFGIFLLRRALRPLKSLHLGVQTLQRGEYSYRVNIPVSKITIRDDLTMLSEGFNEMAASLEASEEWKKQIISDTAHELRTPVSLIMGNLEMILEGVYKADRSRLESLYRESIVLAELIKNLQVLASEESKRGSTDKIEFSLSELVSHTEEDFRALGAQKKITLKLEDSGDVQFTGDMNKTRQVLKNLMANALRHTPENGKIILRCQRQKSRIIVEIEDSGEGISQEYREKIFHRFFKIDKSRNSEGSGLGLSISRIIIENQGGSLTAHEGRSGGALFRISFPGNELA